MAYLLPTVPVFQPSHLDGDPSMATEILPGPPSLASVQAQHAAQKRESRKVPIMYSYLPPSDPGSTYSGVLHGTVVGQDMLDTSRPKRGRNEKGSTSTRAQRASARGQNGTSTVNTSTTSILPNPGPSGTTDNTMVADDGPSLSNSGVAMNGIDGGGSAHVNGRLKRKDKGKGKEIDTSTVVRVKEEPTPISLHSPEPAHPTHNDEHCSACCSTGSLVYCDGCPRAFHLLCLDPPTETIDVDKWYCPACTPRASAQTCSLPEWIGPAYRNLECGMPAEFQLPEEIRTFFKDVTTGPRGTYVDSSEMKPSRKHGLVEDRDAYRLRDRNGQPILCYHCGSSALPESVASPASASTRPRRSSTRAAQNDVWKNIISCDYCDLHWHLDCLDPPLAVMPPFTKKWMCPNHAEKVVPPKRRVPKQQAAPIEITKPRQFNNGNIDIIRPEPPNNPDQRKMNVDEVLINGRRYRVPERIILLDFWNKIGKNIDSLPKEPGDSRVSSPLTSLSSLDDIEEPNRTPSGLRYDLNDYNDAELLCNFQEAQKRTVDAGVQTEPSTERIIVPSAPARVRIPSPLKRATKSVAALHEPSPSSAAPSPSPPKRRKTASNTATPEQSVRELRSRKPGEESLTTEPTTPHPLAATPVSGIATPTTAKAKVRVKVEESENSLLSLPVGSGDGAVSAAAPRKRGRPRKHPPKEPKDPNAEKPKRGRKRKQPDDELPYVGTTPKSKAIKKEALQQGDGVDLGLSSPIRHPIPNSVMNTPVTVLSVPTHSAPATPATPSLKIRLPGRASRASAIALNANAESSSRL